MILRRQLYITLIVILIAVILAYGFLPKPVEVEVVPVTRTPLTVTIEEEGKTRLQDHFEISAPVAGTLCRISWDVGDAVTAGQQLCEIAPLKSVLLDPRSKAEAEDRVAAAEAALRNAQSKSMADAASAEFARAEYKRIKSIFDKKMISRSELERIEAEKRRDDANLQSSRYAVDTARYTVEEARAALSHFATRGEEMSGERVAIHSPIEGQVLAVFHESGGVVQAGQVLMEVGNPHALEVVVELHSADAVQIQPGMRVLLEHWGGERELEGSVRLIEPTGFTKVSALGVEEQRVKVIVDIVSEQERWSRLGDGYRVDAKFTLWEGNDILQIPANALFRYKSGWAVFIIGDNSRAEIQMVEPGKRSGLSTQILSGLNEGQKIVIHPEDTLEPGSKVKLSKSNSVNP